MRSKHLRPHQIKPRGGYYSSKVYLIFCSVCFIFIGSACFLLGTTTICVIYSFTLVHVVCEGMQGERKNEFICLLVKFVKILYFCKLRRMVTTKRMRFSLVACVYELKNYCENESWVGLGVKINSGFCIFRF